MSDFKKPNSQKKYTIASFFSGVGGIELGFEKTNHYKTIYANEVDKFAQKTFSLNFKNVELNTNDIKTINPKDVPSVDIITGGFPCQPFSLAGYRRGFEDERGEVFYDLLNIIVEKKPKVVFIENVQNLISHDNGKTFQTIRDALTDNGYNISWEVLNGSKYGNIPQNRERIYIVGFRNQNDLQRFSFPEPIELNTKLSEIIDFENKLDEGFYYKKGVQPFYDVLEKDITSKDTIYQWRRKYVRENKSGLIPTLTANMGTGGHNVPLIYTKHGIRKLTPEETFKAQGFPEEYILPEIANSHLYKQSGNSVMVPVIKRIAEKIYEAINYTPTEENQFKLEKNGEKYAAIFINMLGRKSGTSYVIKYLSNIQEVTKFKTDNDYNLPFLNTEEYIDFITKKKTGNFIMIKEL